MPFGLFRAAGTSLHAGRVLFVVLVVVTSALFLQPSTGHATSGKSLPPSTGRFLPDVELVNSLMQQRTSSISEAAPIPTLTGSDAGSVVRTVFPGFNTSLPGSFTSSISAWQVGGPAYVSSTDTMWFPQRSIPVPGIPIPTVSPAAVFNLATSSFDQLVTNLSNASALAFDSGNGLLYATDSVTDSVSVINPVTDAIVKPLIGVGSDPDAIAVDPSSNSVFVANEGSSNVTVIDALDNEVSTSSVPVGANPVALIDDSSDGLIFVADAGGSFLSVIRADNPTVFQPTISLFDGPASGFAFSSRTDKLLATIPSSEYATIIDAGSRTVVNALIPVGRGVVAAATSENGTEFVLGNASGGDLVILNSTLGSLIDAAVPVDRNATQLVVDPLSGTVFCWTSIDRILESLNLSSNTAAPAAPSTSPAIGSIGYLFGESRVYASSGNRSLIYTLDPLTLNRLSPEILTADPPISVVADSDSSRLYVGTTSALDVYNATSDQLIGSVAGLSGANSQLVLDQPDNLLWLMNSLSGVSAVNLTSDLVTLSTGQLVFLGSANGIAVDSASSAIFVLTSPTTVRVLNSTNGDVLVPSVNVGSNVTSIVYDAADNQVYAAGDGVSLLSGASFAVDAGLIPIGGPHRILGEVYEPSRKDVFIAVVGLLSGMQGTVSVLDGSSVPASEGSTVEIPVGEAPDAFGVVSSMNESPAGSAMLWVANELSGTLSVLSSPPQVTSFAASPPDIDLGFPTSLAVVYRGGAGQSTVSYYGLPPGCASSESFELNCTPSATGTFTLAANVTDSFGFSANVTATLVVAPSLAVRTTFSLSTFPDIDPGVSLRGTATASDGLPPYSYSWSFSDGNVTSGPNASHAYSHSGIYIVTAEVRDSTGATNTSSTTVTVAPPPVAAVSVSPGNVTDVNIPLTFEGTITGGVGTVRQNWSFGDGSTALGPNATHTWTRPGNYTIDFSSTDALGVMSSRSVEVRVDPSLAATFESNGGAASNPSARATPVTFTSNPSGGTRPYNVEWSFGDESSSSGLTVSHSYATSGTYSVQVTLSDAVGANVTTNLSVVVAQNSSSSGGLSSLSGEFGSGLFLGLVAGGVLAAVVLFTVGLRKGARPPSGPVSPYVPP